MTETGSWSGAGVRIARAGDLDAAKRVPGGNGRVSVFDFIGSGGARTWIGAVSVPPGTNTGPHHHGRHEVAIYVAKGRSEIRWGARLEFAAEIGPGDFAYFPPFVPHQERNLSATETVEFVVVRSDNERIAVKLDLVPVAAPTFSPISR